MLTNEIHVCNFFTMDVVLVGKVTISATLKKINFSKISDQAPLNIIKDILYCLTSLFLSQQWSNYEGPRPTLFMIITHKQCVHTLLGAFPRIVFDSIRGGLQHFRKTFQIPERHIIPGSISYIQKKLFRISNLTCNIIRMLELRNA